MGSHSLAAQEQPQQNSVDQPAAAQPAPPAVAQPDAAQPGPDRIPLFQGATCGKMDTFEATNTVVISDIRYVAADNSEVTIGTLMLKGVEENSQGVPGLNKVELAVLDNLKIGDVAIASIRIDNFLFDDELAANYADSMNAGQFADMLKNLKASSIAVTGFANPKGSMKNARLTDISFNTALLDPYKDKTLPSSDMAGLCVVVGSVEVQGFESTNDEGAVAIESFNVENVSSLGAGKAAIANVTFTGKDGGYTLASLVWNKISTPFMAKYPLVSIGQISDKDLFVFGEDKMSVDGLRLLKMKLDRGAQGISTIEEISLNLNLDVGDALSGAFSILGFQADEATRASSGMPPAVAAMLKGPMIFDMKLSLPDVAIQPMESGGKNIAFNDASLVFKTREIGELGMNCSIGLALTPTGGFAGATLNDGAKLFVTSAKLVDMTAAATGKEPQVARAESVAALTVLTANFPAQDQPSIQAAKDFIEKDGKLTLALSVRQKDGTPSYIDQNDLMFLAQFSQGLTVDLNTRSAALTMTHESTPDWR